MATTIAEKKNWVTNKVGPEILEGLDLKAFDFYYKAMHDHNMCFADADCYAWLNTMFGYDIGADRALEITRWYDAQGMCALELLPEDKGTLKNVCELELGLHLDYNRWARELPRYIRYDLKECPSDNLEISRMITISAAHITDETANLLNREIAQGTGLDLPVVYLKGKFGWLVYVPADFIHDDENGCPVNDYKDVPEDLYNCMTLAYENHCEWLCIDCDGPIVEVLKEYISQ